MFVLNLIPSRPGTIRRDNDGTTTCNALLKITRTKKCFEFCDDNYPDLKIGRCSTRQGEVTVRQELLGNTWQALIKPRSLLELRAGFPPSDHHLQWHHQNWHIGFLSYYRGKKMAYSYK